MSYTSRVINYKNLVEAIQDKQGNNKGILFIKNRENEFFLSYDALYKKALHMLHILQAKGLEPGDELVFQVEDNYDFVCVFWACLLGKIVPVPVTPGSSDEYRLKLFNIWKILERPHLITSKKHMENLKAFVYEKGLEELFNTIRANTIILEEIETTAEKGIIHIPAESDTAFIQFSSGSTGAPKGVVLTHKNLETNIKAIHNGLRAPGADKFFSWMPLTHDMGIIGFHLTPMMAGWEHVLMPPQLFVRYPDFWLRKVMETDSTVVVSPNFGYKYVLKHFNPGKFADLNLSSVRLIVTGAEPICAELCREFLDIMKPFGLKSQTMFPVYGLAEASLAVSFTQPEAEISTLTLDRQSLNTGKKVKEVTDKKNAISFVDVGSPVEKCLLKIVDDNGTSLEDDFIGHILIKGDNVTAGYYNNKEATSRILTSDGWLKTGDLGFQRNGSLYITGRAKEIIFVNGQNYYPHDLERIAGEMDDIAFEKIAFCDSFDSQKKDNEIIAFVVFKREMKNFLALADNLRQHIVERAGLEIDKVIPVKQIPKTTSGKLQRYKLKKMYQDGMYDDILQEINALIEERGVGKRNIPQREMKEQIARVWEEILKINKVGYNDNFFDLGGNSSYAVRVKSKLEELFACRLEDVDLFKHPTINTLVRYLSGNDNETAASLRASRLKRKKQKLKILQHGKNKGDTGMEIAVIGMAGRFPGAKNIDEFWENLKNGVESISFFSEEELKDSGIEPGLLNTPPYIKAKGILENIDCFDSSFFGYTPVESDMMDPQMRVFHHCIWEAMEDAGHVPGTYDGLIGVYAGATPNHYWVTRAFLTGNREDSEVFTQTQLSDKDFMTTRVSYKLNLVGPSITMYTACSTSLVAIDLACQGLLTGKCDIALAGGVSISLPWKSGYLFQEEMLFSRDGHNRSFDADATGTIFSDGAGIVVLKPLDEAIDNRDNIYAVIKGSAINNDGNRKIGYTAPSSEGQAEVLIDAQLMAGIEPESIGYIEAHGSGTILGDPIEVDALKTAFNTGEKNFCAIGSVKTNVGHLNAAAGIAGFIKTVLVLKHRMIPPTIHFKTPNPKIDFKNSPFYLVTAAKEWKNQTYPLRAGVSSQGIGGTNAHVILEEAPPVESSPQSRDWKMLLLSARTGYSLDQATANLLDFFKNNPGVNLADATYTLQVGRNPFQHRRMLVCSNTREAIDILSAGDPAKIHSAVTKEEDRPVVFMFAGLGAQYVNMGRDLYRKEPMFREEMNRCFAILHPLVGDEIKNCLYPSDNIEMEEDEEKINQTDKSQLAIFVFEYALARLIMHWGIKPEAMIGYSFGEYVAACVAGVFSLEDALKLIVYRGYLIRRTSPGMMLSVPISRQELEPLLENQDQVSLAVDNGPSCIVSGPAAVISEFEQQLKTKRYFCMRLQTPHAIHSHMMEPVLKEFEEKVGQMTLKEPSIPYISNFTGKWVTGEDATSPSYWGNHLRHTVQFTEGMKTLTKNPDCLFIEIGPGRDLAALAVRHMEDKSNQEVLNLVRPPNSKVSDFYYLLNKLAHLWIFGKKIDWTGFYSGEKRRLISIPTYPFAAQRYAIEGPSFNDGIQPGLRNTSKIKDISKWFYIPSWKPSGVPGYEVTKNHKTKWLIFADHYHFGRQLGKQLEKNEHIVVMVKPGETFQKVTPREFIVNPANSEDYTTLFGELKNIDLIPQNILHLWLITDEGEEIPDIKRVENAQHFGFYSMLFMAQAVGNLSITGDIQILTVVNNLFQLAGERLINPEKATVLGTCKVIPREYPNLNCRCIDIQLPEIGSRQERKLGQQLLAEFQRQSSDLVVAYRNYQRWVQVLEPLPFEDPGIETPLLREKGVYLITGGLGGIGIILARHLAKTVKARLVLVGRSAFPVKEEWEKWLTTHDVHDNISQKIIKLKEIEALGGSVLVFSADIADFDQIQHIIARSGKIFGPINGIFHAAGVLKDGIIQLKTRDMVEAVFSPKIKGTIVIEESLKNCELDFFILFSSISSILGPGGLVSYCAANAFLDAFAHHKTAKDGTFTTAINWDAWQGVGMAAAFSSRDELLKEGILPGEGMNVLTWIMAGAFPQVVVAVRDLKFLLKKKEYAAVGGIGEEGSRSLYPGQLHKRPQLSVPYVACRDETERKLAEIWQNSFGYEQIGIHDDFFELGGDSLQAANILTKIHKEMNVLVPLKEFFERASIEKVSGYISHSVLSIFTALDAVEKKDYYPVSAAQKRMYALNRFAPDSINYNMLVSIIIEGELSSTQFEKAFQMLIDRHQSLRTSFLFIDDEPVQQIHDNVVFCVKIKERGGIKSADAFVNSCLTRFFQPFKLSQPPLLRVELVKLEKNKHIFLIDMHHIITDGVSMEVLIKEFSNLYAGLELKPLTIQYKDYSAWQNRILDSEKLLKQKKYWLEKFSNEIPVLAMPTDYPRPTIQSFEGETITFEINKEATEELHRMEKNHSCTLYMLLLAQFNILLSKYSGQEDIIVGTSSAGRRHTDLEGIIGMFVNTLAIRNAPRPGKSFLDFLNEVKQNSLEAFENQDYQFDNLIEHLDLKRDPGRNPLFGTVFALQNFRNEEFKIKGLTFKPYEFENKISKFDLGLQFSEGEGKLFADLEYCVKLFKKETMLRFISHFTNILGKVAANPMITLAKINMLAEAEEKQLLYEFNKTRMDYPGEKTIHRLFEEQVERTPDRISIVGFRQYEAQVTYRELNKKSNRLACFLREKRLKPGIIVGLMVKRSIQMITSIMGILKAGCAYLPIDIDSPAERVKYMLEDSGVNLLISQQAYIDQVDGTYTIIDTADAAFFEGDGSGLQSVNTADDPAYIIYTSGSTGKPKGVVVAHRGISNLKVFWKKSLKINEEDKVLQFAKITFDASVWEIFMTLLHGAALYIIWEAILVDHVEFENFLERKRITVVTLPPPYLVYLNPKKVTSLRQLITAGSETTIELIEKWRTKVYYINAYGPTEASICSTIWQVPKKGEIQYNYVPIGSPILNIQIFILGEDNNLLPVGVPGELCIGGAGLAAGYLNRPELTAERFIDNPYKKGHRIYRSGDRAKWLPDSNIEFLGRIDRQVKIQGFRIECGEIENHILKHEAVKEAVVALKEELDGNKNLIVFYVENGHDHRPLPEAELRTFLSGKLPNYMIPGYFKKIDKIPLTSNGKADLKLLETLDVDLSTGKEYVPPKDETERQIAAIWREVLGIDKIGTQDNFFEIGGNSLNVISARIKMNAAFEMDIPVTFLFEHVTIGSLGRWVNGVKRGENVTAPSIDLSGEIRKMKINRKKRKAKRGGHINV